MFSDLKHIRATNIAAIAGISANLPWGIANIFVGNHWVAVENFAVAIGYLAAWLLNRAERHDSAAVFMAAVSYVHLIFGVIVFGYESGAHYFFLLGTVFPFLIFRRASRRTANYFVFVYASSFLICVFFRNSFPGITVVGDIQIMATVNAIILLLILAAATAFFVFDMRKAEDALEAEYARSESLLYNLLPQGVATRLKADPGTTIADLHTETAILFADIVGFTDRVSHLPPAEVVTFLNRIFRAFDALATEHGAEKIKTIGDAYMAAAGMPEASDDPAGTLAEMALDMLEVCAKEPSGVEMRIGIHLGPTVAGVIGKNKLFYDVWGATVNAASRMESHGAPGRIHVSESVFEALKSRYLLEARGSIEVKGIGEVKTWWLLNRKTAV